MFSWVKYLGMALKWGPLGIAVLRALMNELEKAMEDGKIELKEVIQIALNVALKAVAGMGGKVVDSTSGDSLRVTFRVNDNNIEVSPENGGPPYKAKP